MKLLGKREFEKFIEEFKGECILIKPEEFPGFSDSYPEEVQEVAYKIGKSETGALLLKGEETFLVIPPLPVERVDEFLKKDYTLGIILLRLGEYSLGVFKGNNLLVHKTGTQFVSGKIRAGGQSAARFARVREGQINDFFKRVCEQVKEKFAPYEREIEYVFFGGDSQVAKSFTKFCGYLEKFRVMERVLNVRHMKLESLKNSLKEVWKFKVYEINSA